jgi:hypothetical protein
MLKILKRSISMKNILLVVLAALTLVLILAPACDARKLTAGLGQEFQLNVGHQASITGEDLRIEFARVLQDSRCPTGAESFVAGRADCLVHLTRAGSVYEVTFTEPGGSPQAEADCQGYHFTFHVLPYPQFGQEIHSGDYRLVLKVTHTV